MSELIQENQPFPNLEPVQIFVNRLVALTRDPNDRQALDLLVEADTNLSERASLMPKFEFDESAGRSVVVGFSPCSNSTGIQDMALRKQGTPPAPYDYSTIDNPIVREVMLGLKLPHPTNDPVYYTQDKIEREGRTALISLGEGLAPSGAVETEQIADAYRIITRGVEMIRPDDMEFVAFAAKRIGRDLLNEYVYLTTYGLRAPIEKSKAIKNIEAAWGVVGRPFGPLSKLVGRISTSVRF